MVVARPIRPRIVDFGVLAGRNLRGLGAWRPGTTSGLTNMSQLVVGRPRVPPPSRRSSRYSPGMCRSIKQLRRSDEAATTGEIEAAALQFVRKVSGYRAPSQRNTEAFDAAVSEVGRASRRLLEQLEKTRNVPAQRTSRARA